MEGRTVSQTAVIMAQVMLPNQANAVGNVHGGEIMMMMDNASGVVATRHTRANVVTARVESIDFYHPIFVGNLVTVSARLTFVSKHTMEVELEVVAEDLAAGNQTHALTAYFVMVALDDHGRPQEVYPLIIQSEEEQRRFDEGRRRYEQRKRVAD
ncbi:MAG: acyl-CoA thioesterase [Dehalococcoidia bacterium]|nr:acyl-CoA thioesterase [Dehalococcoidia bacterium]